MKRFILKIREVFLRIIFELNTMYIKIFIFMLMLLAIVGILIYAYLTDYLKELGYSMTSEFISSLKDFNNDIRNQNFAGIKNDLNAELSGKYFIKDIYVTDVAKKTVYSSFPVGISLKLNNTGKSSSYKIIASNDELYNSYVNNKKYRIIYVNADEYGYNIYLVVPKNGPEYNDKIFASVLILLMIGISISIPMSFFLQSTIEKPLKTLQTAMQKTSNGDLSCRLVIGRRKKKRKGKKDSQYILSEQGKIYITPFKEIDEIIKSYNVMTDTLQRIYSSLENEVDKRTKELKSAYVELQNTQSMMVHSEKMKSLGELVAGIMHEINNPINFIYGNMMHLGNYSDDLIKLVDEYTKLDDTLKPDDKQKLIDLKEEYDYEFLKGDLPALIKSCKEGADRAKNIIQDLKSFSRMEEVAVNKVDLIHEIDMTLNILHNKLKNKAEIHKEISENIPQIEAFGGQLNQVFMNILDNAAGAISGKGDIWIRVKHNKTSNSMMIEIEDNGSGMDRETANKIFNPFFTTKPVGQGTGLGLSITYKIIKNHQGDIKVVSSPGKGTKFVIMLPVTLDKNSMNKTVAEGDLNGKV